jgi:hypothetical protein
VSSDNGSSEADKPSAQPLPPMSSPFRSSFLPTAQLFGDGQPKKKWSEYSLQEVQAFLGDLQRRCLVSGPMVDGVITYQVAGEAYLRLTKDDVRYLYAAEQYLLQYEIQKTDHRRSGR